MWGYSDVMETTNQQSLRVDKAHARLDAFLGAEEPALSRSGWKALILDGLVTVNGRTCKPNQKLKADDQVNWTLPDRAPVEAVPEDIPLNILFEDDDVLVLSKQAGLVVHPAVGNLSGTLLHGLLFHDPVFQKLERGGIVHRLDKDTSGVMVVGKSEEAIAELQRQFKARETEKEYLALVWGIPPKSGRIEALLGRHPFHRQKQAVLKEDGREAISNFELLEEFDEIALVKVTIETGRTHQIRVHMTHIGHPIVGDSTYGRARKNKLSIKPERQMLHAEKLSFTHPTTGKRLSFEAPLFDDMQSLLNHLRGKVFIKTND